MLSGPRRFFLLISMTFFAGTMITYNSYTRTTNQPHTRLISSSSDTVVILSESERKALIRYFSKYVALKRQNRLVHLVDNGDNQSNQIAVNNLTKSTSSDRQINANMNSIGQQPLQRLTPIVSNQSDEYTVQLILDDQKRSKFFSSTVDKPALPSTSVVTLNVATNSGNESSIIRRENASGQSLPIVDTAIRKKLIRQVGPPPATHVHSIAEMELTRHFQDRKENFCFYDRGFGLDLLVIVISSPENFASRQAIRSTWGGLAVERGAKLLFLIGLPALSIKLDQHQQSIIVDQLKEVNVQPILKSNQSISAADAADHRQSSQTLSDAIIVQQQIKQEEAVNGDILQGSFIDGYYNLTLKSLSLLNWVEQHCNKAKYVLKVDDDMLVNMQLLVEFAETRTYKNVIIGKIAKKWVPHRNPRSKWYIPQSVFNQSMFPNFATGPAYMIAGDAFSNLLKALKDFQLPVLRLEDVFITGIVAERAGVRRLNYAMFKNVHFSIDQCNFARFITSHQFSPTDLLHLWNLVYTESKDDCAKRAAQQLKEQQLRQQQQQQRQQQQRQQQQKLQQQKKQQAQLLSKSQSPSQLSANSSDTKKSN